MRSSVRGGERMSTLDRWIGQNNTKHTEEATTNINTSLYTLPTGAIAIYFKEGEGFKYHYDDRAYQKHKKPDEALLVNLGILTAIWNKLIDLGYSPRYLSKAYDDDIYAIVLADVEKETDEYMEVDRLKIHIDKHPLDAKIINLSRLSPEIPDRIIAEMYKRGIAPENPMLVYQELLDKKLGDAYGKVSPDEYKELHLPLMPMPEILNHPAREIVLKVLNEAGGD